MESSKQQTERILLDLVEKYRLAETHINAHQLLIYELLNLLPPDTRQQLLDSLRAKSHNTPDDFGLFSLAADIVSVVQDGTPPKSMRDILKVIPGGKTEAVD
ncbi:hypothetical protein SBF1_830013 [Candidatus Desulfosporosinus infrequens]|uniref:Uncharacterized protein n=1 Tax=Candidatus Desulfosporosinus infrequens TaxID=2043169 RepID=A0A2U3LUH7_9FIRM|nr:hypothetical protein SBF1_830013 [Candidatus Desulfosporosinus infrequens]